MNRTTAIQTIRMTASSIQLKTPIFSNRTLSVKTNHLPAAYILKLRNLLIYDKLNLPTTIAAITLASPRAEVPKLLQKIRRTTFSSEPKGKK
jgi:hypothetical protein